MSAEGGRRLLVLLSMALSFIVAFLISLLLMMILFPQGPEQEHLIRPLALATILLMVISMAIQGLQYREAPPRPHPVTIIRCLSCGKRMKRDFTVGDYVYKRVGTCECGGTLIIDSIYVELRRPPRRFTPRL